MNETAKKTHKLGRIAGLDLARFLAFFGMVFVNFKIVMVASDADLGAYSSFYAMLEGRAAALFVILAGVGLGLIVQIHKLNHGDDFSSFTITTLKRGLFLFAIGMANSLIFDADILHYYGVYFFIAAFVTPLSNKWLKGLILATLALSTLLLFALDYDQNWNWDTLEYANFWTLSGGLLNLFYNGWHPVLPWITFLFIGVLLSRTNLSNQKHLFSLMLWGIFITLALAIFSNYAQIALFSLNDPELDEIVPLFALAPVPPTFLYIISASASAIAIIAASILFSKRFGKVGFVNGMAIAGKQTLTLYIAHIYLGMLVMDLFGMLENSSPDAAFLTTILFVAIMAIFTNIWANKFKRGPLEMVMRKICG